MCCTGRALCCNGKTHGEPVLHCQGGYAASWYVRLTRRMFASLLVGWLVLAESGPLAACMRVLDLVHTSLLFGCAALPWLLGREKCITRLLLLSTGQGWQAGWWRSAWLLSICATHCGPTEVEATCLTITLFLLRPVLLCIVVCIA